MGPTDYYFDAGQIYYNCNDGWQAMLPTLRIWPRASYLGRFIELGCQVQQADG